jgi:hypothetical protein
MEIVIDPQIGKREETQPQDHCQNSQPKESIRISRNTANHWAAVPQTYKKRALGQHKSENQAATSSGPENPVE